MAELVSEVRLLRLAMQGEVADDRPPTDETYLTLTELASFAPASKKTLREWANRPENPMPVIHRPKDGAVTIQWGAFKRWYAEQDQAERADDTVSEKARGILISLKEERN